MTEADLHELRMNFVTIVIFLGLRHDFSESVTPCSVNIRKRRMFSFELNFEFDCLVCQFKIQIESFTFMFDESHVPSSVYVKELPTPKGRQNI